MAPQDRNRSGNVHEAGVDGGQSPAQRLKDCLLAGPQECLDTRPECGLNTLKVLPLGIRQGNTAEPVEACGRGGLQVYTEPQHLFVHSSGQETPVPRTAQACKDGDPGWIHPVAGHTVHVVVLRAFLANEVCLQRTRTDTCSFGGMATQRYPPGQEPVPVDPGTEGQGQPPLGVVKDAGLAKVGGGQPYARQQDPVDVWFFNALFCWPFHTASRRFAAPLLGHLRHQPILQCSSCRHAVSRNAVSSDS